MKTSATRDAPTQAKSLRNDSFVLLFTVPLRTVCFNEPKLIRDPIFLIAFQQSSCSLRMILFSQAIV